MGREKEILKLIIGSKGYITVNDIANNLNISAKTVRNDLLKLEECVKKFQCELIKKPGKGIMYNGDLENTQKLINSFDYNKEQELDLPVNRQQKILLKLFTSVEPVLIKELSIDFYVSRATINNDISTLNEWLSQYNVSIKYVKSQGVHIVGKEKEQRNAMAMLFSYNQPVSIADIIKYDDSKVTYTYTFRSIEKALEVDFNKLIIMIQNAEKSLGYVFSTESTINLAMNIAVAISRVKSGHSIILNYELVDTLKCSQEFKIVEEMAKEIEKEYNMQLPKHEKYYMLLHFMGAKILKNDIVQPLEMQCCFHNQEIEEIIREFIQRVQAEIGLHIENDSQLFESLILHIKPSINRILYGLTLHNPLLKEIKENYSEIFGLVSKHKVVIDDYFQITLPEDEIAYLVLHFVVALERSYKSIRILIACASGIGISQLLVAKLERLFKKIEIVDVVSIYEIEQYKSKNIDLIISTVDTEEIEGIKTIVVSPLLSENDINNITDVINHNQLRMNLDDLFYEKNIYLNVDIDNKNKIFKFMHEKLLLHHYVTDQYYETIVNREKKGSTYIGNKVAVVHGDMSEVIDNCLQIIQLKNPIRWNDEDCVDFIINVVCTKKHSIYFKNVFRTLGNYLDDTTFWDRIKSVGNPKEMAELLNKELAND